MRKDGKELKKHHACSLWLPLAANGGAVGTYMTGEVCGGRHAAKDCPHWGRAFFHATLCKDFSQQWRIELEDKGHADDVARYRSFAEATTRAATAEEAQDMEAVYASHAFPGKTATGSSSSAAR